MSPVDIKDAVKATLDDIKSAIGAQKAEFDGARSALDAKIADLAKEAKTYGSGFGDTKAKVDEIAKAMADISGSMQKHASAIERINADLKAPGRGTSLDDSGGKESKEAKTAKAARRMYAVKHYGDAPAGASVDEFDETAVNADLVKAYNAARDVFWRRVVRVPKNWTTVESVLAPEDSKALDPLRINKSISTISHGNRFWLPTEMADMIVQCYDDVTDLSLVFSEMWISRGAVEIPRDNDVNKRALFKCELDCAPVRGGTPAVPGTVTIQTHEMHDSECVTHTMLEDSEIDIEGWLVPRVAEGFSRGRNEKFMWGQGNGEPEGLMRPGNHLEFPTTALPGGAGGQFTWQHLRVMPFQVPKRFQAGGSYMFSRDALMSLFTMSDANGRPLMDGQITTDDGITRLWGIPAMQIDQLHNYLNAAGTAPEIGSKPIGFGDWESAYLIVNRHGFFALRDPAYSPCGVTWHFGARCGGGVLCHNATVFLKIA
jgi:HK97 family phage major capsid protein